MHVSVQKCTRTTRPPSSAGPSGSEFSHSIAPPSEGMWTCANTMLLAQRAEPRAQLGGVELRLLPGGEVPASVELVVVDEVRVRLLRPAPRSVEHLVGEDAHGNRDADVLDGDVAELGLAVQPGGRDPRIRQPEQRDVVQDIVAAQAFLLPVEGA